MNAHAFAQNAYGANARTVKTPRDIEYDVLARITGQLQTAIADTSYTGFPALAAAMVENQQLWSTFAVDLADPNNQFPKDLRARLFYLAEFVMQHTRKVLNGTAKADALVELNMAVMRGLRGPRSVA
ncbi:flagellar biosynthesis regulator FlaF [Pararhodobacter sp. SW119]|uniref:flagellar biosynthesis regulator FlaF n=1 Tax=Pararhodobacter sp. SW119 TaxID=2780075 RepID=UPI001AE0BE80|nr:flagellar biosynthesis regulator FlaF [Pararhodobacter sp. SW119]